MKLNVLFRFANIEDACNIANLHIANIRRTYQGIYSEKYFERLNYEFYKNEWEKYLLRDDCRTIICECNGEIIGFAGICLFYIKKKIGLLDYLHVKKEYERQGVAHNLISEVANLLLHEKICAMEIWCVEGNNLARKFYDKLGAKYVGTFLSHDGGVSRFTNRLIINNIEKLIDSPSLSLNLENEYSKLQEVITGDYIVWGLGDYYDCFCEQFCLMRKPKYIFDLKFEYQGLFANGVSIISPFKTDIPIIITCSKYKEIERMLLDFECSNYIRYYPWHKYIL